MLPINSILVSGARLAAAVVIGASLSTAFLGTGCAAQVQPATPLIDDEVEVVMAPVEVERYPRAEYQGHVVYLVDGKWQYLRGHRWYYYRNEPASLVRHRAYIQSGPPAGAHYVPAPG